MMKRLLIMVGCITICLLTNLSLRVPTPAAAQATPPACQTAKAPTFVIGSGNNLFYLGTNVQFTTQSAGAQLFNFSEASNAAFGIYPGYAGTTGLGFSATGLNNTATAISCQDSFWDITFEIAGSGATAGDVITLYFQKPDGSGRIDLASFEVMGDNMSVRVVSLRAGLDLSAIGHTPTTVGTIIPYSEAAGAAGKRTQLITIALPMDGSIPDCNQLAVSIKKDGNGGTTTVALLNIVVNRMGNLVQGTSVNGTGGTYATGLKCDTVCPKCVDPLVCDLKVCFKDPCDWCIDLEQRPSTYRDYCVKIPFVNSGMPIMVYNNGMSYYDRWGPQVDVRVQIALGCGGYWRPGNLSSELIAEYVAAQLSFQERVPNFYWIQLPKQKLACHIRMPMAMPGMPPMRPALPLKLSNGKTLDNNSSLQDLFDATEWAWDGTWDDREGLLAIYKQLDHCKKD